MYEKKSSNRHATFLCGTYSLKAFSIKIYKGHIIFLIKVMWIKYHRRSFFKTTKRDLAPPESIMHAYF